MYGVIGGVSGAGCMSALRMAAHRLGLIEKAVPQVVEEWAVKKTGVAPPGGPAGHQAANHVLHLGYGAAWGALYGWLLGHRGRTSPLKGLLFGAAQWGFGFFFLMPALGVTRPAWRMRVTENALNLGAHLLYGVVTALLTEELDVQQERTPATDVGRRAAWMG